MFYLTVFLRYVSMLDYDPVSLIKTINVSYSIWSCKPLLFSPPEGGLLPQKLGRGVRPASQNPYPIYDQNLRFSLHYLWPDC